MKQRTALWFVVAFVMALAVACGSDEDSVSAEPETATTVADATRDDAMDDDAMDAMDDDHDHDHEELVEAADVAPVIAIDVTADPVSGANVAIDLENFTITPANASSDHVDGEGHLHLFVDGERVGRVYNTWTHVALEPGDHSVMVQVSSNDHRTYGVDGEAVEAMAMVTIEPSEHHHHDDLVVAEGAQPGVSIETFDDPKSGVNVHVTVENFTITPANASSDHVDGEGHFHVYVDGTRVGRLYGEWVHIDGLSDGEHLVEVEVGANDHRAYDDGTGAPLRAAATVVTDDGFAATEDEHDTHEHDMDVHDMDDDVMEDDATTGGQVISVEVVDGDVVGGPQRVEVEVGTAVTLNVAADAADEIHVHAYDLFANVAPDAPGSVTFTANIPGVFEIELEGTGTLLVDLEVS